MRSNKLEADIHASLVLSVPTVNFFMNVHNPRTYLMFPYNVATLLVAYITYLPLLQYLISRILVSVRCRKNYVSQRYVHKVEVGMVQEKLSQRYVHKVGMSSIPRCQEAGTVHCATTTSLLPVNSYLCLCCVHTSQVFTDNIDYNLIVR